MTDSIRIEVVKEVGKTKITYAAESTDAQAAFNALNGIISQQENLE